VPCAVVRFRQRRPFLAGTFLNRQFWYIITPPLTQSNHSRLGELSQARGGKQVFQRVDTFIFEQLWHWAKRRHPRKPSHWVKEQYFRTVGGNHWVFTDVDDQGNPIRLFKADLVPVTRHVKIQGEANPYDPEWENYFEQRYLRKWKCRKWGKSKLRSLWKQQGGHCPMCGQGFNGETSIHSHHIVERCKGGGDNLDNLVLLHPTDLNFPSTRKHP